MNYNVISIPFFDRKAKRLLKKYPSLKDELLLLKEQLKDTPDKGISLGNNCYKIKMAIHSKSKGKSGGARVITTVYVAQSTVYLLTIFDKSEAENITDNELLGILQLIKQ